MEKSSVTSSVVGVVERVSKRGRNRSMGFAVAFVLLALSAGVIPLQAASPAPLSSSERSAELKRIRERIELFRTRLADLETGEADFEVELERLDLERSLQRELVAEAVAQRTRAEEAVTSSAALVAAIEVSIVSVRDKLASRMVALYRATPGDWLRAFVSIRDPGDFFLYLRTLRFLARRDADRLAAYEFEKNELATEKALLEERKVEAARLAAAERARLTKLDAVRNRQRLVVEALARERAKLESGTSTLSEKERKLALLIAVLAGQEEAPLQGTPIQNFQGVLDWPVEGRITTEFGPRQESRYKTSVPHNGIRIGVESGEVRSVFPGSVIFAAPFEGFGLTVVVHHPRRVFSLYAGLGSLEVQREDVVTLGQVLGSSTADLYFEMRVENRPEDPTRWLR